MLDFGYFIGEVGLTYSETSENKRPALFYSYSDTGNDSSEYGVGTNWDDFFAAELGVSTDINAFVDIQISPNSHAKLSLGTDGICISGGLIKGQKSADVKVRFGWGTFFMNPYILNAFQIPIPATS